MEKINRNDPCMCGSGKKFKKCCERQQKVRGKFDAKRVDADSALQIQRVFGLTGMFEACLAATSRTPCPKECLPEQGKTVLEEKPLHLIG